MDIELKTIPSKTPGLSLTKAILLHLFPGILMTVVYILIVRMVSAFGYPKVVALGITSVITLIPATIVYMLYTSKKENGFVSLSSVVPYRKKISVKDYFIFVPLLFIWFGLMFTITKATGTFLLDKVFYWLPDWFLLTENIKSFPKNALVVTFFSTFLLTGLIAPIVEELYFRGFLLPRMSWMGKCAPLVNTVLFTVYHFWSPWQIITRILALLPMVYVAKWTKNVYIGIIAHCMLNVLADEVPILILILSV